ncbi:hypothetical protein [Klebsiella pneumoniae]|uniref:hypothetical protein n=1 Tax=Klebsiella pneumoniae TaxID=573 RepID=UPI003C13020C
MPERLLKNSVMRLSKPLPAASQKEWKLNDKELQTLPHFLRQYQNHRMTELESALLYLQRGYRFAEMGFYTPHFNFDHRNFSASP